jgi:hypothetical protein
MSNTPPPIDALPVEVLEAIFQATVDDGLYPETLCAISRRWREIATGYQLLWCDICLIFAMWRWSVALEYVRRRIQRSGHCGLSVTILFHSISGWESSFRKIMAVTVGPNGSAMRRWKQLSLDGPIITSLVLFPLLRHPTPVLQELNLSLQGYCPKGSLVDILPQTPQLRLLNLNVPTGAVLPRSIKQSVSNLVLSSSVTYHGHDLLVQFSSLTFLELNTILSQPYSTNNLQLPHLRALCIRHISGTISSFLNNITIPVLESLHLHLGTDGKWDAAQNAQHLFAHILPQLLDLKITKMNFQMPEELVGLLKPAKNLRSLQLEKCGPWSLSKDSREPYHVLSDSSLCPNLRSCIIEGHEQPDLIALRHN